MSICSALFRWSLHLWQTAKFLLPSKNERLFNYNKQKMVWTVVASTVLWTVHGSFLRLISKHKFYREVFTFSPLLVGEIKSHFSNFFLKLSKKKTFNVQEKQDTQFFYTKVELRRWTTLRTYTVHVTLIRSKSIPNMYMSLHCNYNVCAWYISNPVSFVSSAPTFSKPSSD